MKRGVLVMAICRLCGSESTGEHITVCPSCGSSYMKTGGLWNEGAYDLSRRMGRNFDSFDFKPLFRTVVIVFAGLGVVSGVAMFLAR